MAVTKRPWTRKNPKKATRTSKKLTTAQKTSAKRAAKRAGRKYPNLVDNMNAAKKKR
jgi:ribosomal protein L15E